MTLTKSTIIAMLSIAAYLAAIAFAHADTSECSAATERDAIAAYGPLRMGDYSDMFGEKRVAFISGYCAHAVAIWARETKARETDCSSATQRDAMAEYDKIAEMVGIPPGAPIYTLEKRQYVAAVCLHEELRGQ
jgi:hypothetical protein